MRYEATITEFINNYVGELPDEELFEFGRSLLNLERSYSAADKDSLRDWFITFVEDTEQIQIGGDSIVSSLLLDVILSSDWREHVEHIRSLIGDRIQSGDYVLYVVDGAFGQYIPQTFAERYGDEILDSIGQTELSILLAGPSPDSMHWEGPNVGDTGWDWESSDMERMDDLWINPTDWDWMPIDHSQIYWDVYDQIIDEGIQIDGYTYYGFGGDGLWLVRDDVADIIPDEWTV